MGLFEKPEVIVLKESSDAKDYLAKLEELHFTAAPVFPSADIWSSYSL